jgi:signal transduction histidine kinase
MAETGRSEQEVLDEDDTGRISADGCEDDGGGNGNGNGDAVRNSFERETYPSREPGTFPRHGDSDRPLTQQQMESLPPEVIHRIHDVNNALTAIHGNVSKAVRKLDLLSRRADLAANPNIVALYECLQVIKDNADIANRLLSPARYETGQKTVVTISDALHRAIQTLQEGSGNIGLETDFDNRCYTMAEDVTVLTRVFVNVIKNAIEAINRTGKIDGKIIIKLKKEDGLNIITIQDNGTGLPEDFSIECPSSSKDGHGHGVGLGSVRKIIADDLNGRFFLIDNKDGKGACAIIGLPMASVVSSGDDPPTD